MLLTPGIVVFRSLPHRNGPDLNNDRARKTMTETLRYGIIGAQNWGIGGEHVRTVLAQDGVDLVAVCNHDEGQRQLLQDAVPEGTPIIADSQELLGRSDLDAVVICTPNHTHVELAEQAFGAGLHVLCEKPLGRTVAEYDAIIAARDRAGRQLLVAARDHARQTGAIRLELSTGKDNTTAQSLYEANGWLHDDEYYYYSLSAETKL